MPGSPRATTTINSGKQERQGASRHSPPTLVSGFGPTVLTPRLRGVGWFSMVMKWRREQSAEIVNFLSCRKSKKNSDALARSNQRLAFVAAHRISFT
jgi:hypothetical protein